MDWLANQWTGFYMTTASVMKGLSTLELKHVPLSKKTQLVPLNPFELLKVTANLSNTGNKFRLSKKRTPLIYGPNFLNQRRLVLSELTVDKTATHYVGYNLLTFFDKSCVV